MRPKPVAWAALPEDVFLPDGKENCMRIALKEVYSKTLGRTIALYRKYSLEAVQEYVRLRREHGATAAEPVFATQAEVEVALSRKKRRQEPQQTQASA